VFLLHSFALGEQLAAFQVAVDLEDGSAAVRTPLADGAEFFPKLFFGKSGNIVYR
ncbi:uncharacterized protein METZ01_LOCUS12168, partial [marine metagenome]